MCDVRAYVFWQGRWAGALTGPPIFGHKECMMSQPIFGSEGVMGRMRRGPLKRTNKNVPVVSRQKQLNSRTYLFF